MKIRKVETDFHISISTLSLEKGIGEWGGERGLLKGDRDVTESLL